MSNKQLDRLFWFSMFSIFLGLAALVAIPTFAQDMLHRHALGHGEYLDWASGKTLNCCNNEDCHYLKEGEFRETAEGTELKVREKWCPVKQEHFVTKGKSPDWSRLHACINENTSMYPDDCERILCFMRDSGT